MEVHTTGKDVGTGQSTETQLCTIGAATDRLHLWRDTTLLHSLQNDVDHIHLGIDLLLHVVVLILDGHRHRAFAILLVHLPGNVLHEVLTVLKLAAVVIANDIAQLGLLTMALDAQQMIEALIAFCGLRNVGFGNVSIELTCQAAGVDHLALGISCVHTASLNGHLSRCGIEVLILQITDITAVHRISPVTSELLHIEMVGTHADLLVGIEGHTNLAMLDLLVIAQVAHGLNYLCDARLVVGTEQRSAVGDNQILTFVGKQLWKFLRRRNDAR